MILKTEASVLNLSIDTEDNLDNCIKQLESTNTLTSITLHISVDNLPFPKINKLTLLIGKQINLDTLAITADVTKYFSKIYAIILQQVFTKLDHLRVLIFRGIYCKTTLRTLVELILNTECLSVLSVGRYYPEQESYGMTEIGGVRFGRALVQNSTLTDLDLKGNKLNEFGVATIINSLKNHASLKTLNLSDNIDSPNKYIKNYSGEGILELLGPNALQEIYADGYTITPSKLQFDFATGDQLIAACTYLLKTLNIRHLDLSLPSGEITSNHLSFLAFTINYLPQLEKLELYDISTDEFQFFCEKSLVKPSSLTEIVFVGIWDLNEKTADSLIQLIKHNTNLTSLTFSPKHSMDYKWINSNQALELGEALGQNQNLLHLKLENTQIDDPKIIAKIIKKNQNLLILDLKNNGFCFGPEEVLLILEALNDNTILLSLNLCSNKLIFPENMNKKIHLIDFHILKYPEVLEGILWLDSNLEKENSIDLLSYRTINKITERNRLGLLIQKYLLLQYFGSQIDFINTDVIHFIFRLFLNTLKNYELEEMSEIIRESVRENIPESYCSSFLLKLGANFNATHSLIGNIALLAVFGVINLPGAVRTLNNWRLGCLGVSLGIFGFYKANCKQEKDPVAMDENSSILTV